MTRLTGVLLFVGSPLTFFAQGGGKEQRAQADALFAKGEYAQAYSAYEILLGNDQQDFDLNFRYGVCALHAGADKGAAIAYLKRSTQGPAPDARSWYWLGKAYHLTYRFKEALVAYERFRGTADKKALAQYPVDAMELQCRNGQHLLSNLKDIDVHNKVEVDGSDFFRFYDLSSIGGRIVVTPEELKSTLDKKSNERALIYLPDKGGRIYFASYGKSSGTGRDIYRTELLPNGEFATPTKLAGYINTNEDEDFPFMAPDGKSFYFC
ncbi:MAG: tetratricopeptide repeat protein, partial [Flavobacteriales bacterium]|nr:tetratricopeptide repeat protein [Flavobacteriales bacterium]